jgi:hypothetical protein
MTRVKKEWKRVTDGKVFERGKMREVIVVLMPQGVIGFRLMGTRRTYFATTDKLYWWAIKQAQLLRLLEKAREKKQRKFVKRGYKFSRKGN